jgi:hypothetical protein
VREIEELIRTGSTIENTNEEQTKINREAIQAGPKLSVEQETFRQFLGDKISTKVEIKKSGSGSGKIAINFASEVDLNRIISLLSK